MTDVNKRIDELIEIAKKAKSGEWEIEYEDEDKDTLRGIGPISAWEFCFDNYENIKQDAKYITTFNPTFVLKLLQSWKEMRIALEYINQDEWPGEALPVENDDGEINYSNLIDYYGKLTSEVLDKADKVFE